MGFWDVLFFNIATVLGPRWVAAAAHNGTSSISLWVLAALFFFVPTALVINELSSRFPNEGGLYVWSKEAFGDFHGFVAGWTYWIYTVFYFPGFTARQRRDERLCCRARRRRAGAKQNIFAYRIFLAADRRRGAEHHRPQHWQVAAKCRRRLHLHSVADAVPPSPPLFYIAAWLRHALHLRQHDAALESRHRQFLVADRFCVHRTRTGLRDERRNSQSAQNSCRARFSPPAF